MWDAVWDAVGSLLGQAVNRVTVAHAIGLFILARAGWGVLRWGCRLVVYVVGTALLRHRRVVRICAFVLVHWQVDLGYAILDLHPDHLTVRPSVGGVQGTNDASANLTVESSARQFRPQWSTGLRPDRMDEDTKWSAWAKRQDRRADYRDLLEKELRRAYRFPPDE